METETSMTTYRRAILEMLVGSGSLDTLYPPSFRSFPRKRIQEAFWRLRHKELISYQEKKDGTIKIALTEAGKKKAFRYKFDAMEISEPRRWDRKWRIVAFDIPEGKKPARNALAEKLKQLGLKQFQKSLWIYPYPCKDEIDFVAEILEVGKYVHYIEATGVTNDAALRDVFEL